MKPVTAAVLVSFLLGYAANDVVQLLGMGASPAHAEVAGMDRQDLRRDRDFRRAVEDIVVEIAPGIIEDIVPQIIEDIVPDVVDDCLVDDEYIYC